MTLNADRPQREYTHKSPDFAGCDPAHHWISYERADKGVIVFKCQKCGSVMQEPTSLIRADMQKVIDRRREAMAKRKAKQAEHGKG